MEVLISLLCLNKLLRLYLISEYSCHPIKKTNSGIKLKTELKEFFININNSKNYYDIPEPVVYNRISRLRQYRRASILNPMRDRVEDARDISLNVSESPTINTIINPFRPRREIARSPGGSIPELRLNVDDEVEIPLIESERSVINLQPPPPPPPYPRSLIFPSIHNSNVNNSNNNISNNNDNNNNDNNDNNDNDNNDNNDNRDNRDNRDRRLSPSQSRQLRFRTTRRL